MHFYSRNRNLHTNNLDLDVDLNKAFAERVDFHKTGVDSSIESSKLRNQTNITLRHWLVWIGADDAAGNGTKSTNT
jgi:hypothetical protein